MKRLLFAEKANFGRKNGKNRFLLNNRKTAPVDTEDPPFFHDMGFIPGLYVEKGGALWYNQKINDHSTFRGNGGTGRAAAGRTRAGAAEDRRIRRRELL